MIEEYIEMLTKPIWQVCSSFYLEIKGYGGERGVIIITAYTHSWLPIDAYPLSLLWNFPAVSASQGRLSQKHSPPLLSSNRSLLWISNLQQNLRWLVNSIHQTADIMQINLSYTVSLLHQSWLQVQWQSALPHCYWACSVGVLLLGHHETAVQALHLYKRGSTNEMILRFHWYHGHTR